MNKIELTNSQLIPTYNNIFQLAVPNARVNKAKFKLLKLINRKVEEFEEDKKAVMEFNALKDADGNPMLETDGESYLFPQDNSALKQDLEKLLDEGVVIEYGEYVNNIHELFDFLEKYEGEIDGNLGEVIFWLTEDYKGEDE